MNPQLIQLALTGIVALSKVISNSKPNNITYNNCNINNIGSVNNRVDRSHSHSSCSLCTSSKEYNENDSNVDWFSSY